MANRFRNAGLVEQLSGWSSNVTLALDTSVKGAPGRAALTISGTLATAGSGAFIFNAADNRPTLTPGQKQEFSVLVAGKVNGVAVLPQIKIIYVTSLGGIAGVEAIVPGPAEYSVEGEAVRGLRGTYRRAWARLTAPASTATYILQAEVYAPSNGSTYELAMVKPFGDFPTGAVHHLLFDPGPHTDADLNLPAWPALRPFRNPPQITPVANRTAFQTAAGINKTRLLYAEAPVDFRGQVRCTPTEADTLEQFYRAGHERFWIVRPDTDELCVATWLPDGAPRPSAHLGLTTIMDVGLQLTVA